MDREDMIAIIAACEDFFKIDEIVRCFTDSNGIGEKFTGLWELLEVLRRNCNIEDMDFLIAILKEKNIRADKKYELITLKGK